MYCLRPSRIASRFFRRNWLTSCGLPNLPKSAPNAFNTTSLVGTWPMNRPSALNTGTKPPSACLQSAYVFCNPTACSVSLGPAVPNALLNAMPPGRMRGAMSFRISKSPVPNSRAASQPMSTTGGTYMGG